MSGIESLVTQVHRGESAPRVDGQNQPQQQQQQQQQPQQQPQQQKQQTIAQTTPPPQQEEKASCWSRIFCCGSKKTQNDHTQTSNAQNNSQSDDYNNKSQSNQQQQQPQQQSQQQQQQQQQTPKVTVNTTTTTVDQRSIQQSPRVDGRNVNQFKQDQQQQQQQGGLMPLHGHTNGYTLHIHKNYNPVTNEYDFGDGYHQYLLPPLPPLPKHKKTLVLDLDETLVHSSFKRIDDADFQIEIELEGTYHQVYVRKRPYVDEFLLHVAKNWEVVIFTASLAKYADPLLDMLDTHRVISKRLFRESCVHHYKMYYVKDLRLLGRPLSDSTIIDNSPFSYMFQPEQGLPIISWYDDRTDTQLRDLLPFLDMLANCRDIVHTMTVSQPLFVDGGIVTPYQLPDVPMLSPEEQWNEKDEVTLQKYLSGQYDTNGSNGSNNNGEYQQMMMTIDSNEEFQSNNNIAIPQTPQVNRSNGRSALNSPVAGKRDLTRYD